MKFLDLSFSVSLCIFMMISGHLMGDIFLEGGPEIYYFERKKEGGTRQHKVLEGGRLIIERIEPFGLYLGFNAFWGGGVIEGFNASGKKLVSEISDQILEGRIGYTLVSGNRYESSFTFFGGYGKFEETNAFQPPSPIRYTSIDTFNYLLFGFLSGHNFHSMVSMGLNFEIKFMYNGESKISDDYPYDDITLHMTNEFQARLELPLKYQFGTFRSLFQCPCSSSWEAQLVPFYEYRHFGGREDYPFDFIDTKFNLIGVRLGLGIRF